MNVREGLEALAVGPDEVLILKLSQSEPPELIEGLLEALKEIGLERRALVIHGDVEFAKVARDGDE